MKSFSCSSSYSLSRRSDSSASSRSLGSSRRRERRTNGELSRGFFPSPQKTVLPSGVRIVTGNVPLAQSFALGVWIDVGSCDEAPNEFGMTHCIEHLVFRGAASPLRKRSSSQIARSLESVGGYLNAFTTKDHTCYYARALNPHLRRALALLADMCLYPAFHEADLETEKSVIIEEIRSLEEEPEEMANDYLDESLFGKGARAHPFAHPISGSIASVQAIRREQIVDFHRRLYTADRIVVAAAGDIDHDKLVAEVERAFTGAPVPKKANARAVPIPLRRKAKEREVSMQTQQNHYAVAALIPAISDSDYYALSALNIILGDGMSSRLNQVVREKHGLCYTIYSALGEIRNSVITSVYASFEPSQSEKGEALIRKELRALAQKPVGAAELRRAKEQLKAALIMGLESLSGYMTTLAKSELYVGRFESLEEKIAAVESVRAEDILRIAETYFQEQHWHSVRIVPETE